MRNIAFKSFSPIHTTIGWPSFNCWPDSADCPIAIRYYKTFQEVMTALERTGLNLSGNLMHRCLLCPTVHKELTMLWRQGFLH